MAAAEHRPDPRGVYDAHRSGLLGRGRIGSFSPGNRGRRCDSHYPRFFYKYRGVEKIAEGRSVDQVILLSERFSGTSAFAHSLAFCQAVEDIAGVEPPPRAKALRIVLAELERLRHHIAAIAGICDSTALSVATSQAGILEEEALRITGSLTGHRYLFGLNRPGGLTRDFNNPACLQLADDAARLIEKLCKLNDMLRFTSSFLDRIEEVGIVSREQAITYGLVGPIARASGLVRDLRNTLPYGGYEEVAFDVPVETEGDGYARLRILFREAEQSAAIIRKMASVLPDSEIARAFEYSAGGALGWVEAPRGGCLSLGQDHRDRDRGPVPSSRHRPLPTGMAFTWPPRILRFKTFRSSWPLSDSRTPSRIDRRNGMTKWVLKGLRTGIVTTAYPDRDEEAPGVSPGLPFEGQSSIDVGKCPTRAFIRDGQGFSVDTRRCVHCLRCAPGEGGSTQWQDGYEWAARLTDPRGEDPALGGVFRTSLHIRVVDAGACGACLSEIEQLNKPYYNIHRLGFFITPTPGKLTFCWSQVPSPTTCG